MIAGLVDRFDEVLAELEAAAGWKTARVRRPVAIYGSLDGILTTVRNQIRTALAPMDRLYPQQGDPGAVRQQLMRQRAMPRPFDLDTLDLAEYKGLVPAWRDWATVVEQCRRVGTLMATAVATRRTGRKDVRK